MFGTKVIFLQVIIIQLTFERVLLLIPIVLLKLLYSTIIQFFKGLIT